MAGEGGGEAVYESAAGKKFHRHALRVPGPGRQHRAARIIAGELPPTLEGGCRQSDARGAVLTSGDEYVTVDRRRQHETVVVIGVLADEVHAAGCAGDEVRLGPELPPE